VRIGCSPQSTQSTQRASSSHNRSVAAVAPNQPFACTRSGSNSPALDKGSSAKPGSGMPACAAKDQRGVSGPQAKRCDMGAYERWPVIVRQWHDAALPRANITAAASIRAVRIEAAAVDFRKRLNLTCWLPRSRTSLAAQADCSHTSQ